MASVAVATYYLQTLSADEVRPKACPDAELVVREAREPCGALNQWLYTWVGGPWHWRDKLPWSPEEWQAYAATTGLRTFIASWRDTPVGYFELYRHGLDEGHEIEIEYFGLAPPFLGRGWGGYFLTVALQTAWATAPRRVWVHTCSLDHPAAIANYQARGMRLYLTETDPSTD